MVDLRVVLARLDGDKVRLGLHCGSIVGLHITCIYIKSFVDIVYQERV